MSLHHHRRRTIKSERPSLYFLFVPLPQCQGPLLIRKEGMNALNRARLDRESALDFLKIECAGVLHHLSSCIPRGNKSIKKNRRGPIAIID